MQRLYSKPLPNTNTLNISIIGMNGSGKSAIVVKYLTRRFIVEYAPYLSDSYVKTDSIDGQEFTLNIQDTSDSDEIDLDDISKWSQVIIVLFSMTSRRSFYRAQELIEALKQVSEQRVNRKQTGSSLSPQRPNPSVTNLSSPLSTSTSAYGSGPITPISLQLSPGPVGSLRRAAFYTISTTKPPTMILVANKLDLERFRLVEKSEAESIAKVHGIPYFEVTVTETYKEIQNLFHAAARLCIQPKPGKSRGANGSLNSTGRGILTGVGITSSGQNSVLSSLAVSPGLLLQKKNNPLTPTENSNTYEAEQNSSNGSSSILSNLRLRATSPPSMLMGPRSSSPGPNNNAQNATKSASIIKPPQSASNSSSNHTLGQTNSTKKSNPTCPTKITLPTTDQACKPANPNRTLSPSQGSSKKSPAPPPAPPAPPVLPKKSPMGFKFFSKRTK